MQRVILNYFLYPTLQKITIGIDAEMILWTTQMEVRMVSPIIIPVLREGILIATLHTGLVYHWTYRVAPCNYISHALSHMALLDYIGMPCSDRKH